MKPNDYDITVTSYFENFIGKDFDWASTHCVALALGVTDAIYGTNYLEEAKETYDFDNEEGARVHCANGDVLKYLKQIGYTEVTKIHSGDVLYCEQDGWECLHVYSGGYFVSSEIGGKVNLIPPRTLYRYLHLNVTPYTLLSCHK